MKYTDEEKSRDKREAVKSFVALSRYGNEKYKAGINPVLVEKMAKRVRGIPRKIPSYGTKKEWCAAFSSSWDALWTNSHPGNEATPLVPRNINVLIDAIKYDAFCTVRAGTGQAKNGGPERIFTSRPYSRKRLGGDV